MTSGANPGRGIFNMKRYIRSSSASAYTIQDLMSYAIDQICSKLSKKLHIPATNIDIDDQRWSETNFAFDVIPYKKGRPLGTYAFESGTCYADGPEADSEEDAKWIIDQHIHEFVLNI